MLRSMTGFGQAQDEEAGFGLQVEIRCLNARQLKIHVHLPPILSGFEVSLRNLVRRTIGRGAVAVHADAIRHGSAEETLNLDLIRDYWRLLEKLGREIGQKPSMEALLTLPDIVRADLLSDPARQALGRRLERLTEQALADVVAMQETEGNELQKDLEARLGRMEELCEAAAQWAPQALEAYRKRLQDRAQALVEALPEANDPHIWKEVVLFSEKSDVSEELARLRSHLGQFREGLAGRAGVGKRLEFLAQEMQREATTLGAKAVDVDLGRLAIELRTEVGRIREQVANVE